MKKIFANFCVFLMSSICLFAQEIDKLKTKHVIVLIVDGPRYSETWGDSTHQYIPKMANEISKSGVVFTNFYNDGYTYTTSGHTAICTGHKQELENSKGSQLPDYPSIFQYFLKTKKLPASKAFVITSKDKLQILANCNDEEFHDKHLASTICGVNGMGTGYGNDTTTFRRTMNVLNNEKPDLLLVNFKEPDASGHANNWNGYLKGIRDTDSLVWEIWKFIQQDEYYKNSTTLFVTNDHGRHTDGHKDGFVNHGDHCDGCRHINLFAMGPDFKNNLIENKTFVQVDLTATIAQLLGFKMPYCQGKSIGGLFK
jgi:arylsulfatase A-like enzyme